LVRLADSVKNGLFVASENLTVMVSSSPNTASSIGSGSAAFIEVINGPAFCPNSASVKVALNVNVDASDVPSLFLSPPANSTFTVNVVRLLLPPVSSIVMTRTDGLIQVPSRKLFWCMA